MGAPQVPQGQGKGQSMTDRDRHNRQGRIIALVIAGTGLAWIAAMLAGEALGWSQRTRALLRQPARGEQSESACASGDDVASTWTWRRERGVVRNARRTRKPAVTIEMSSSRRRACLKGRTYSWAAGCGTEIERSSSSGWRSTLR